MNRTNVLMSLMFGLAGAWIGEGRTWAAAQDGPNFSSDVRIVRRLLDVNGLGDVSVSDVAVRREGRVVELKLYGRKTSQQNLPKSLHVIPPDIGRLEKLEKLVIASNDLPKLPETIYDLQSLTELDLSNNGLESLSPKVGKLRRLRKLRLMMNHLVEVPASIGELADLTVLDLSINRLRSLPEEIGSLAELESLGLRLNSLSTLPASVSGLKRLETLDLIENRITEVPEAIYDLKTLQHLYLSKNEIEKVGPKVGALVRLRSLALDRNKLTTLPVEMKGLVDLEYFTIEGNLIEDIDATLARVFSGKRKPRILDDRQEMTPKRASDSAFTISKAPPLADGRPVIDIKPNGKNRPEGTGPSGSYFLVVRQNGAAFYLRWFTAQEAASGARYDLSIPNVGLEPEDKLTVGVENINPLNPSDYVKLSNVLGVPHPPARSKPKVDGPGGRRPSP